MPSKAAHNNRLQGPIAVMYLVGFLFGLHSALPAYISSTFLSGFVPADTVGIIYAGASLLSIAAFSQLPRFLRRFGNYAITLSLLVLEFVAMLVLALMNASFVVVAAFIASFVFTSLIGLTTDILLEHSSRDNLTGQIRGAYLVAINGAWVLSQVLIGALLHDDEYWKAFALAALLVLPVLYLIQKQFKRFPDPLYRDLPVLKTLSVARLHPNIWNILVINSLLQFFFSWMVIYTPIYLHTQIGFAWEQIALMFSVMLLPFLGERVFGKLADKKLGEKEMLVAGFIILSVTSASVSLLHSANLLAWAALLFVSRIGAALVESMSEIYFFKHVHDSDASLIGLFRTTRPWAYIISPILATIILPFVGIRFLFVILAVVLLYDIPKALALRDTK